MEGQNNEQNVEEGAEQSNITEGGEGESSLSSGNEEQNTNQTEGSSSEEAEQAEVFEHEGKQYVSKEEYEALKNGFEKRVGALTAKSKAANELLDTIRTNPEVRERFLQELGVQSKAADQGEESEESESSEQSANTQGDVLPWSSAEQWLSGIQDTNHKSFYTGMLQAVVADVQKNVASMRAAFKKELESAILPVRRYIGETSVKSFASTNKDFDKYKPQIAKLMQESGMTIDQAYKVAKYEDLMKSLSVKQGVSNKRMNQPPVGGRQTAKTGTAATNKMTLDDAIKAAMRETGFKG